MQRIEIRKHERTYLYVCYGHLPEAAFDKDCIYFMRNTEGMVNLPNSIEEANETLPVLFEIGILNGHSLVMLENVISQVYMPLLSFNQHRNNEPKSTAGKSGSSPTPPSREATTMSMTDGAGGDAKGDEKEGGGKDSAAKAMLRDEFLINMQKFASSITRTIQQIEGEVRG